MKQKTAIIGVGKFGRILLKSFLEKTDVVAISSNGNQENLREVRKISKNIIFRSNLDIAKDKSIESVVIASSIDSLFSVAKLFVSSGKHVFLEKPGCTNYADLQFLKSLLKKDQVLYIDYLTILDPVYKKMKSLFSKEDIESIKFFWEKTGSFEPDIFLNLFCHELSVAYDMIGVKDFDISHIDFDKKFCSIRGKIGNVESSIFIDRSKPFYSNRFYVKTKDFRVYLWDKKLGKLFLNDKIIVENLNFDLVNLSRDTFLDMIKSSTEDRKNLELSISILKTIGKIKK